MAKIQTEAKPCELFRGAMFASIEKEPLCDIALRKLKIR